MRSVRSVLYLVLVLVVGCGGGAQSRPAPERPAPQKQDTGSFDFSKINPIEGVQKHVLDNGLTVLLKQDSTLPFVTVVTAYKVGGANDPEGVKGVAHFFEHMMFNGTTEFDKAFVDQATYESAGSNNAYTTSDATVYWFHVSRDALDRVLYIESTRMTKLVFDTFDTERKNVLEELNRDLGEPWGRLYYELVPRVFTVHPYHHPVIGRRKDLEEATREKMEAFYRDYYAPNNATLVIHGDFDPTGVLQMVRKHFGALPKGKEAAVITVQEPPQTRQVRHEYKTEDAADRMMIAWKTAPMGSDDDLALDVLSTILTGSKTARLNVRLVEQDQLVPEGGIDSANESRRYVGMFYVEAEPYEGKSPKLVEDAVFEELAKIAKDGVTAKELQKAKNIVLSSQVYRLESGRNLADALAYSYALNVPDYVATYLGRVDRVTADQVRQVASKYLNRHQSTVVVARGKGGGDKDGRPNPKRHRTAPVLQGTPDIGQYYDVRLPNGLTVIVKPKLDLPVVSIRAYVESSPLYEPEEKAGLAALLGEMLDEGTQDPSGKAFTDEQLAEMIEEIGGTMSTGPDGVSFKALSKYTPLVLDLMREILVNASFPADRFEIVKRDTLQSIKTRHDDPETVMRDLFDETVFKGHPNHRPAIGYKETVEKLTRQDVIDWYRKYFRPDNTIIVVAGHVEPLSLILEIRKRFADWGSDGEPALPRPVAAPNHPGTLACATKSIPQVNILIGHAGVTRDHPDYVALRVAETILCSSPVFSDRFSRAVRVEGGLAYSVGGSFTGGADRWPGTFSIYAGTEAKNKDTCLNLMLKLLREFVEQGPTEEEVATAKNYLAKSFFTRWETGDGWANYLLAVKRLNLGTDYHRRFQEKLASLTRDEVHAAVKRFVKLDRLTTVIVGPVDSNGKVIEKK